MGVNRNGGRPELADIARAYLELPDLHESAQNRRILGSIAQCRTATFGWHLKRCDKCAAKEYAYNSCWSRYCPRCQGGATFSWVNEREEELLPAKYHQVVFTLPQELEDICYQNKLVTYNLVLKASARTLEQVGKRRLGVKLGALAVLHTWDQELKNHVHPHFLVPCGGVSLDDSRWIALNDKFLLPVRVLSKVYRGKFISYLKKAYYAGKLNFYGKLDYLKDPGNFEALLWQSVRKDWVVYSEPPFGGPNQLIRYLASYVNRIAISNSRIIGLKNGRVYFLVRHRIKKHKRVVRSLELREFVRRFLRHTFPKGFRRVRYFGCLANRKRERTRALCAKTVPAASTPPKSVPSPDTCCRCGVGRMVVLLIVTAKGHRIYLKKPRPLNSS